MRSKGLQHSLVSVVFVPLFLFLVVFPLLALIFNLDMAGIVNTINDRIFWIAVRNTLLTAFFASVLGLIVAIGFGYYHLYSRQSLIYKVANLLNDLPIALPHTVAGLALLLAFGRNNFGFAGKTGLAFTLFAVVLGMFFVSYALCARSIATGVDQTEREVVDVARTLGDTPTQAYFKIVLPSIGEAVFSGFVLAFARSLSEFAAVIMFGGNLPGRTQVLASYVFTKVEEGELEMAVTASVFCILLALALVAALSWGRSVYAHSRVAA